MYLCMYIYFFGGGGGAKRYDEYKLNNYYF